MKMTCKQFSFKIYILNTNKIYIIHNTYIIEIHIRYVIHIRYCYSYIYIFNINK